MRQREIDSRQHRRRRQAALLFFSALAALLFIYPLASSIATGGDPAQQRRRRTPGSGGSTRRPSAQTSRTRGINYSNFLHDDNHVKYDKASRANCNDCHQLASPLQFDIKDYPDHPSCVNCHRQQFFMGARPVICTVCHQTSSPRDARRFDFPRPNADVTREFPGRFPHGLHQSLLAREESEQDFFGAAHRVRAPSNRSAADARAQEENCATCHAAYDKTKKGEEGFFPGAGWPDNMLAGVSTFRKIPDGPEGHRTCFACHASSEKGWKSPSPVANDCAGCHSKTVQTAPTQSPQQAQPPDATTPARTSATRMPATLMKLAFANVLLPSRKVFNFQHEGGGAGGSHEEGCTTCHINITEEQTLVVKPDVPIASCAICHIAGSRKSSLKKGTDTTITTEMDAWLASKKACISCHLAEIGTKPPPCSHYYADRRAAPPELQCK